MTDEKCNIPSNPRLDLLHAGEMGERTWEGLAREFYDEIERLTEAYKVVDEQRSRASDMVDELLAERDRLRAALEQVHGIQQDQVMQYDEKLRLISRICIGALIRPAVETTCEHRWEESPYTAEREKCAQCGIERATDAPATKVTK
jgi:hypothetical protein